MVNRIPLLEKQVWPCVCVYRGLLVCLWVCLWRVCVLLTCQSSRRLSLACPSPRLWRAPDSCTPPRQRSHGMWSRPEFPHTLLKPHTHFNNFIYRLWFSLLLQCKTVCVCFIPKPSKSRSSLMTRSSSESPGDPFTVIFSPSLLMKWTVTLLSDLTHTNTNTVLVFHYPTHFSQYTNWLIYSLKWIIWTWKPTLHCSLVVRAHNCTQFTKDAK